MAQKMFADHVNSGMTEVSSFSCPSIRLLHVVDMKNPATSVTNNLERFMRMA